eukprot:TRINITY_DN9261_c0_g1_i2.p1 TRINITY_DN9261_c0_g1~~TRINITY_DN9261_c0_g1_i2.p1  ORF type:complete len:467 (+),score=67.71 TRINITY_DN9261_c0_g1_i2:805-2205(+)
MGVKNLMLVVMSFVLGSALTMVFSGFMLRGYDTPPRSVRNGREQEKKKATEEPVTMDSTTSGSPVPGRHMSMSKLLNKGGLHMDPEEFLPWVDDGGKSRVTSANCIKVGMQRKCHFKNFMVYNNTFHVLGAGASGYPNPIYPADGLVEKLKQYHKYEGHRIHQAPPTACERVVTRPTIFLYRMSGHSTYHLWENNLGPFYQTLQQFAGLRKEVNDPRRLLVAFVDLKPVTGPKAPYLLDTLLQSFTDLPLVNASRLYKKTCFENAIVGVASSTFEHFKLLNTMRMHVAGHLPPPLPPTPHVLFISRNHHTVIRGRKISNEQEAVAAANQTVFDRTGKPLEYIHMQDLDTYQDQVKKTMSSHIIIGPHGGGIANCIWMQKGSVVMEMAAPAGKTLFELYHSMCKKSGITHLSFVAEPDPGDIGLPSSAFNNNKRLFSNLMIPPEMMVQQMSRALDTYYKNYEKSLKS